MGAPHWVTCVECGSRFDVSKGGYYNRTTGRYACKKCGKTVSKAEYKYCENKSWFARYWKVLIGILLIMGGYGNCGSANDSAVFGVVAGLALLAWYFVPKYLEKKKADEEAEQIRKREEEERTKREREVDERRWICKRCGAHTKGRICEYCDCPDEQ